MSYVRLCDRCGRRLDGREPKIRFKTFSYILSFDFDNGCTICDYDLCKTCVDDLKKFLKGPSTGSTEE